MGLIEQLGGYDNAKDRLKRENVLNDEDFRYGQDQLLKYRRQHNIFEAGDKVVFKEDLVIGCASDCIDLMIVQGIDAFGVRMTNRLCPWAIQIRHATPDEIKAGYRL